MPFNLDDLETKWSAVAMSYLIEIRLKFSKIVMCIISILIIENEISDIVNINLSKCFS